MNFFFRPTFIHRFIIKNTVEHSIYQATSSNADNWDKSKVTLQNLINLFKVPEAEDTANQMCDE